MAERELANQERRRFWVQEVVDFCYSYDSDNISAFCRERGISASSFNYWFNRIRQGLYEQGVEKGLFKGMRPYSSLPIMLDVLHNNGYAMDEDGYLVQREYRLEQRADRSARVFQPVCPGQPLRLDVQETQQLTLAIGDATLGIDPNTSLQSALRDIQAFLSALKETTSSPAA